MTGRRERHRYTITPQDGADDDGGTLYVLRDETVEVLAGFRPVNTSRIEQDVRCT